LGVALHELVGTGPGGRIRQLDVLRAGSSERPSKTGDLKGPTTVVPLSTTGETIARRMTQSRSEIPSFEVVMQADMTMIVDLSKELAAIAAETRELVARARARRLTPEELTASTFTVSNLGMFDVHSFTAVINAPQVAILAVGAVTRSPVETAGGGVVFRDAATL